ncbi:MAG TPA: hypothetical protein DCP92_12880 [Nitrospiraceae bacterium]|nr:hypothetical protein [Nitrospiraceae bacterium]
MERTIGVAIYRVKGARWRWPEWFGKCTFASYVGIPSRERSFDGATPSTTLFTCQQHKDDADKPFSLPRVKISHQMIRHAGQDVNQIESETPHTLLGGSDYWKDISAHV